MTGWDDYYDRIRDRRGLPYVRGFGEAGPDWSAKYLGSGPGNGDAARNQRRNQIEKLPGWMRAIEELLWP